MKKIASGIQSGIGKVVLADRPLGSIVWRTARHWLVHQAEYQDLGRDDRERFGGKAR